MGFAFGRGLMFLFCLFSFVFWFLVLVVFVGRGV